MTQPETTSHSSNNFLDRRGSDRATPPGVERRQFTNSHDDLSPRARELAIAIDDYKISNRRRFITYEEVLSVVESLGYRQAERQAER